MENRDWILSIAETVVWYSFFYYLLFAIRQGTTLWEDAAILLGLTYIGFMLCPWVHRTKAWKETIGKLL